MDQTKSRKPETPLEWDTWLANWAGLPIRQVNVGDRCGSIQSVEIERDGGIQTLRIGALWSPSSNLEDWQRDVLPKVLGDIGVRDAFLIECVDGSNDSTHMLPGPFWLSRTAQQLTEDLWNAVHGR